MNEKVLTQYIQELSNTRMQLEYTVLTLKAEIEALKANATKESGTDKTESTLGS